MAAGLYAVLSDAAPGNQFPLEHGWHLSHYLRRCESLAQNSASYALPAEPCQGSSHIPLCIGSDLYRGGLI